jgi:glycosyltransferase involved in cell wall biosynthesis
MREPAKIISSSRRRASAAPEIARSLGVEIQADHEFRRGGTRLSGTLAQSGADLPLVTVVTAVFNGQPYLAGCLESVLGQDYTNIEHIVIDGGSTDGTLDVLGQFNNRIAFWKSEPDQGVYDAWNQALAEARGEWICFLGVDDAFLPGAVSDYMAIAAKHPKAEYLSSRVRWVHPSGYERTKGAPWAWPEFSRWMCSAHPGSMHRRSLFDRLGTYDASFGSAADYELLLRARGSLQTAYLPRVTVMMRGGGMTDNHAVLADSKRAKITTGGRNPILAAMELGVANAKYLLRPLRRVLGRIAVR